MAEPTPQKSTYNIGSKLERFDPVVSRAALSLSSSNGSWSDIPNPTALGLSLDLLEVQIKTELVLVSARTKHPCPIQAAARSNRRPTSELAGAGIFRLWMSGQSNSNLCTRVQRTDCRVLYLLLQPSELASDVCKFRYCVFCNP